MVRVRCHGGEYEQEKSTSYILARAILSIEVVITLYKPSIVYVIDMVPSAHREGA